MAPLNIPYLTQRAQELTFNELLLAREAVGFSTPEGNAITGFLYPFDNPIFFVKFGNRSEEEMLAEARTQQFAFDSLEKIPEENRKGIYIPRIFRILKGHDGTFIIMELVYGKRLDELSKSVKNFKEISGPYYNIIAQALKLFLSFPVPPDAKPGPCGWGKIRHVFFKEQEAPRPYKSVNELEKHINNLATWFNKGDPTVTLERKLHFVYADLYTGNFMFTDAGDLYIIDFEHASFLPLSFMEFALHCPSRMSRRVACRIRNQFQDLPGDNLAVMKGVSSFMLMSDYRLGLP